jgi:hypothetical protein
VSGYLFTPFGHLADGNPYDAYLASVETLPGQSDLIRLRFVGSGRAGSHVNGQAVSAPPSVKRDMRILNRVLRPHHRNGTIRRR